MHSGPKKCDQCEVISPNLSALREHKKKHKGVTFYCDFLINGIPCGKDFHTFTRMKAHRKNHTDHTACGCHLCPAKFKYSWVVSYVDLYWSYGQLVFQIFRKSLTTHYLTVHIEFDDLNCFADGCTHKFSRKDNLVAHMKQHHSNRGPVFMSYAMDRIAAVKIPKLSELRKISSENHVWTILYLCS